MTGIPQAIGAAAVAAIKFITPKAGATSKIDGPSTSSQSGFSEIQPFVDLNQIAFGVLGVAALGTVGYGLYAKNNNSKNRRRISYDSYQTSYPQKRSAENSNDLDQLWLKIGQQIIKGKTMIFNYLEIRKCLSLLCLLV